ncbi:MAG: tRNA (adenosine(37)-N6)-threonylcarbamoyltransferase complex dimerization subunit type 1 TsaB [Devosia sp.]
MADEPAAYLSTMSVLLAIDTAAPRLQLALLLADGRVETLTEDMATGQAERLFPALDELLTRTGVTYNDLTRIAVTTGPGSFTGLRIGLSAARGLALALSIPVLGIPSLFVLSLNAQCDVVAVLIDARRDEAYFQTFSGPGIPIRDAALLPMEEARRLVPQGAATIVSPFIDIAALARFALTADPALYPPEAAYIRDADAKPQEKFRIARISGDMPA